MSVLSAHDIQRSIGYSGFNASRGDGDPLAVEPASMDLHLGEEFASPKVHTTDGVVVDEPETYPEYRVEELEQALLPSGSFALATTEEEIDLPSDLVGIIHGRSSVGRLGLFIHNAGFIDPGFGPAEVTLELFNAAPYSITLKPGMRICQLALHETKTTPSIGYSEENGNKYNGQRGPTPSRLYEDFE